MAAASRRLADSRLRFGVRGVYLTGVFRHGVARRQLLSTWPLRGGLAIREQNLVGRAIRLVLIQLCPWGDLHDAGEIEVKS
jgi:hypothetical protein